MDDYTAMEARLAQAEKQIQDLSRRADGHERNGSDLGKSMTEIIASVRAMGDRLTPIEKEGIEKRIAEAVAAEREIQLQKDITSIKGDIAGMKDDNKHISRLIIGAIVTGVFGLGFLLIKGGLGV